MTMSQVLNRHRSVACACKAARTTWNVTRWFFLGAGMLLVLWSCNPHPLTGVEPEVTFVPSGGTTGTVTTSRPKLPPSPFAGGSTVVAAGGTGGDTGTPSGGATTVFSNPAGGQPGPDAAVITVLPPPDAAPPPPAQETYSCPAGDVRIHIRDVWSSTVTPTMNTMTAPPMSVIVINPTGGYDQYGARQDSANCSWYSVCVPNTITTFQIQPIGPDACPDGNPSGAFDASQLMPTSTDIWLDYTGPSSTLAADYSAYPNATVGPQHFRLTNDQTAVASEACPQGQPDQTVPSGFIKVHFRWPWGDPEETGFPGSACGASKLGHDTPPYPSSLKVTGVGCGDMQALLEFQDNSCPWYYVLIPTADWTKTAANPVNITFRYPDDSVGLWTPNLPLPVLTPGVTEYWIGYAGAPDNTSASIPVCMDWSQNPEAFYFYTQNPGPGYTHCGGSTAPVDPCSPPLPPGFHTIHFRYIWAGQKTFTYFPKPQLMPEWMELEVSSSNEIICFREADRPWFNCPVPDALFVPGATWRAVDKTRNPEWNTVAPRPLENPTTEPDWLPAGPLPPGEYWLRWEYGKPDIPTSGLFRFYNYYPDSTNGDWSATSNWNDSACAPKPPAQPVTVGFGYGGWFPYASTNYLYPNGGSLAYVYPDVATVQDLFNAFVFERYLIFRDNYVTTTDTVCGPGTARIKTNPPKTVSEGQGYGMAIAAAIGDKPTFDALWNFVRHYLSQAADKYCGGLMGWMWDGTIPCRTLDSPCDPAKESCSGNEDSAFDGDVDIAIGLVYAALQWPEYTQFAVGWLTKMECEIDTNYDSWNYPTEGDTGPKNCQNYPGQPCSYTQGDAAVNVHMDYYPPGYFRVFGDFLAAQLGSTAQAANGQTHHDFWYKVAQTVYVMLERCYNQAGLQHGFVGYEGTLDAPCSNVGGSQPYEWERALWRLGIDAAWFGNDTSLPEAAPNSSQYEPTKSKMQSEIDHVQDYFNNFYVNNPPEAGANRFSTICDSLPPSGVISGCDPGFGHNSYTVNTAMCAYASVFNDGGATTLSIRQEAIEESISTTVENDAYLQEPLGVYSILFLTGNFPNPMTVPTQ